ncbi:MAG TPA: hydrogenase maturation protease [Terracidiphilus sp.]|nr:hydrogenase maturation protease [Terracidiphilus sp.]
MEQSSTKSDVEHIKMTLEPIPCLVLACGNTLREDDGVGPWLANQAGRRFPAEKRLRILASQQWTPELAEEVARARTVIFVDCESNGAPGSIRLIPVEPAGEIPRMMSHHLSAPDLLALSRSYYGTLPTTALLLTVGAGSLEMREGFSKQVAAALPDAENVLIGTALRLLEGLPAPATAAPLPAPAEIANSNGRNPEDAAANAVSSETAESQNAATV